MRMPRCGVGVTLLLVIVCVSTADLLLAGQWGRVEDYYALKYADLVVQGTISRLADVTFSGKRFYKLSNPDEPDYTVVIKKVHLEIEKVHRGELTARQFDFLVPNSSSYKQNYSVGQRIIASCNVRQGLDGLYQLWGDTGRFIWIDGKWECQLATQAARVINDDDLTQIVEATTLAQVRKNADAIVLGEVVGRRYESLNLEGGEVGRALVVEMKPLEVYKGSRDSILSVALFAHGHPAPKWARGVPRDIEVGQRYVAFLKANKEGYYPFAGSNGFFRVEGKTLNYHSRRPYALSKAEMLHYLSL